MPAWKCPKPQPSPEESFWLQSIVGTYPPYLYATPGLLSRFGSDSTSALLWARAASAVTAAIFLGLAACALWDPRKAWVCLLGLIGAVTPMVLFVGSSLTPSGPETASGICFAACLLRLGRADQEVSAWVWAATGISGAVLAMARDPGLFWVAGSMVLCVGLSGPKPISDAFRKSTKPGTISLLVLLTGVAAAVAWQATVQVHPPLDPAQVVRDFSSRLHITKEVGRQQIGVFGWLDTLLPSRAYIAWVTLIAALGSAALLFGSWLHRFVLAISVGTAVAIPVILDIVQREVGFGVQGRHVLPFTVIAPLVAGEILSRNAQKLNWLRRSRPMFWFCAVAASVNSLGWLVNAKRYTVGPEGPFRFWAGLNAAPPMTWTFWVFITGAAGLLGLFFGVRASFSGELR